MARKVRREAGDSPPPFSASFKERVYERVALIPCGWVTTYGAIARALGAPHRAREVGWALFATPAGSGLPAHRVVNAHGALSGGWAFGGEHVQRERLQAEGIRFLDGGRVDLGAHLWTAAVDLDNAPGPRLE